MNMIKRYSIHIFSLHIILFFSLIFFASCTYDYFEDETNYVVYAPKANVELTADEYKIEDIHIYIYKNATLVNMKRASHPFKESARMREGNFNFRLFPTAYDVFCFANTGGIVWSTLTSRQEGGFGLPESESGEYLYPSSFASFSIEMFHPAIDYPAPVITDTAYFNKRYSGRICIAFEKLANFNPSLTYSNIGKVKVTATGTGTYQNMALLTDSINTRSGSYTSWDKVMMEFIPYENPFEHYEFGIDGYFFPSLSDGRPISLWMDFFDHNGNMLHSFLIDIVQTLHMNQTIYLGTDGMSTFELNIDGPEQWEPEIVGDDDGGMGI
ncbi:hypothetical protein [Proteiniphilum sp. UBA5384]|uniref:hypothetical protein n=1 Tax=Proteiniphilum sp. UBA5384 TaxID=1947279 RepID=UPI0025F3E604|nr:hypothetical protein [Proteiniphilum sp. UBA5384]